MFRLNETTELNMEEIHRRVLPFVPGTRNLWRQVQYWIKRGAGDQEHLRKTSSVFQKLLIVLLGSPSALLPESCNYHVQQCTRSSTRAQRHNAFKLLHKMETYMVENHLITKQQTNGVSFEREKLCIIENEELNPLESEINASFHLEDRYARIPGAKKHKSVRRYPCPYCNLRLASRSNLDTHIRIHTRSQPFLCDICGKVENTKFNLDRHTRSHFHIYDYMCGGCKKSFHSLFAVRRHIRNIHKRHVKDVDHFRIKKKFVEEEEMMFIKAVHKNCNYYKLFYIINDKDASSFSGE